MQKYLAKNLTNRTLHMHLPGGRYMRLAPGGTYSLNQSDCKLPMVKKMIRKNALIIPNLPPPGKTEDEPDKAAKKDKGVKAPKKADAASDDQQSDKDVVEAEASAGQEAGSAEVQGDTDAGSEAVGEQEADMADESVEQEAGAESTKQEASAESPDEKPAAEPKKGPRKKKRAAKKTSRKKKS